MRNFIISRSLLLAVAPILLCLAGSESVLAQSPADITALPQQIDSFLTDKRTPTKPLAGMGEDFVSLGSQYGVDPRLIVAISGAESSFGAHVCTQSNAWNWFWEGPCPKSP